MADVDDEATEWYISRAHAVRALGYLGATLAEDGDLDPEFEQPKLLEVFADGLAKTISVHDYSPVDAKAVSTPSPYPSWRAQIGPIRE